MKYRKVTAIIPDMMLEPVEQSLVALGIPGMTVSKARGFGAYRNYYTKDYLSDCVRVEVFSESDRAHEIADAIARAAHRGTVSDGVIAITPVEDFIHIHQRGKR